MVILLVFGGVIGRLAGQRVHDDFNRELRGAVRTLAGELVFRESVTGERILLHRGPDLDDYAQPNGATVRIFDRAGNIKGASQNATYLGPPVLGLHDQGDLRVATAAVSAGGNEVAGYVQYARSRSDVDSTIERLWLFIAAGVFGGTLLASLAGLAIADRAMRPIAALTAAAREIAATGDPSREIPQPATSDEVAELAKTLDQMLRALDSAQTEREAALDRQREFVADASHELRTPLTSVLANLELLQASLETRAGVGEEGEIVESALRSSRRMGRLVSDLLLLARADSGRSGERRPCDLREIAASAAAEVASVAGNREIAITDDQAMPVEGNADELHRLVLNLLENAVRHTPDDAKVELRLRRAADEEQVILEVADDGPGIPAELREQIFSRFVRGFGPADTVGRPGTGLGLAIVRAVASSHGGDVEALESKSGGALFRVSLPLSEAGAPSATGRPKEPITGPLGSL